MANIDLSNVEFYRLGKSGASEVVGNDWVNNAVAGRVARYTITPPPEGANGLRLNFKANYHGGGDQAKKIGIRYFIGTSEDSHTNAGSKSEYTGEFSFNSSTLEFTAETDMMLYPGQTYYLWLFPASNDYGWYMWDNPEAHSVETVGGLGLVYINTGSGFEAYMVYIKSDTSWDQYIPYIKSDTSWDMYT